MDCWVSKGESIKNIFFKAADVKITGIFFGIKKIAQTGLNQSSRKDKWFHSLQEPCKIANAQFKESNYWSNPV